MCKSDPKLGEDLGAELRVLVAESEQRFPSCLDGNVQGLGNANTHLAHELQKISVHSCLNGLRFYERNRDVI